MDHVVSFSGGLGSWAAAMRVAERYAADDIRLLFADTLIEDADLYRFLIEGAAVAFGLPVDGRIAELAARAARLPSSRGASLEARVSELDAIREACRVVLPRLAWIAEGRTIWQVFRDERMLGSTRMDPCSRTLKRRVMTRWLKQNCDPASTVCHVGIDWTEEHRFTRLRDRQRLDGWTYAAPLCEEPLLTPKQVLALLALHGLRRPRLYDLGMAHNNCGGGCVKAGQGHFARLLRVLPEVYAEWEEHEQGMRDYLAREDATILRDRTGGTTKPMTLTVFRRRIEAVPENLDLFDRHEIGGCGCAIDEPEPEPENY